MTATAVEVRPSPAPVRVPAVASTAIREILEGPPQAATVFGTATHAIWFRVGERVIVVTTNDATRLPNGVEIGRNAAEGTFLGVRHGVPATIGLRCIALDGLTVDAVRWWNPRPALPVVDPTDLASRIAMLPGTPAAAEPAGLTAALSERSVDGLMTAATRLLGGGPGLTPEGDDTLAGALSATRILAEATGDRSSIDMLDSAAPSLSSLAAERTTMFSAALIDHAIRGEVARPAASLLRALAGRGDVRSAHTALTHVGHSSGPALAAGITLAARTLSHTHIRSNGGTT